LARLQLKIRTPVITKRSRYHFDFFFDFEHLWLRV